MKYLKTMLLILACSVIGYAVSLMFYTKQLNVAVVALQEFDDLKRQELTRDIIFTMVDDPTLFYNVLEVNPEWEKVDVVPYSECYRHLIDDLTYDYLFCKAI